MPSGRGAPTVRAPVPPLAPSAFSYTAQLVVDRQSVPVIAAYVGGGRAVAELPTIPDAGYGYLIERVYVFTNSTTAAEARAYVGAEAAQNAMDLSLNGNEDVADENSPIYVPTGVQFQVIWSGITVPAGGLEAVCRVQYSVIQFVPATWP